MWSEGAERQSRASGAGALEELAAGWPASVSEDMWLSGGTEPPATLGLRQECVVGKGLVCGSGSQVGRSKLGSRGPLSPPSGGGQDGVASKNQ